MASIEKRGDKYLITVYDGYDMNGHQVKRRKTWEPDVNMTDYQIERVWQPMFMANGRYNINEHWQVNLSALCKPTGMFHLNAKYYGAEVRAGFAYQF